MCVQLRFSASLSFMLHEGNMLHNSAAPLCLHCSNVAPIWFPGWVKAKEGVLIMALMVLPFIGSVSVSEGLLAIITLCLVYLILKFFQTEIPEGLRCLPGPKPLPIIGNLLEIGSKPYQTLTAMSKHYGDVFQIQIGMRPVVVLSGSETVRQALIKQGEDFAGRPDLYSFQFISEGKSLAFSTDQAGVWRARRKLAYSALRSFATLKSPSPEYSCVLEEHVCKEAEYLISEINTVMKQHGSFNPFRHIVVSVANVICGICFGKRYDHNHQELLSFVSLSDEFNQVAGSGNPADFIPILQYLPSTTMKKFKDINSRFNKFVKKIVSDHYASFDKVHSTSLMKSYAVLFFYNTFPSYYKCTCKQALLRLSNNL